MKIYIAACESVTVEPPMEANLIDCGFASYYYCRKKTDAGRQRMQKLRRFIPNLIVDSGAHTFFSQSDLVISASTHKATNKLNETPEAYWKRYLEWLLINQDLFDYFVELDIGEIIGQATVYHWREEVLKFSDCLAQKMITVYHPTCETPKTFRERLKDLPSRYAGLEGYPGGKARYDHLSLIRACYEQGIRAHGFAMTKLKVYDTLPFYSVDSSTFIMPQKYGNAFVSKENSRNIGQLPIVRPKTEAQKKKLSKIIVKNKMSFETAAGMRGEERTKEAQHEGLKVAMRNARRLQNQVTRLWVSRGVDWETLFNETHRLDESL